MMNMWSSGMREAHSSAYRSSLWKTPRFETELREKHGISLRELEFVSGVRRPTIHACEQGAFTLSADKEVRLRLAIDLIAEHRRAWAELPKPPSIPGQAVPH